MSRCARAVEPGARLSPTTARSVTSRMLARKPSGRGWFASSRLNAGLIDVPQPPDREVEVAARMMRSGEDLVSVGRGVRGAGVAPPVSGME